MWGLGFLIIEDGGCDVGVGCGRPIRGSVRFGGGCDEVDDSSFSFSFISVSHFGVGVSCVVVASGVVGATFGLVLLLLGRRAIEWGRFGDLTTAGDRFEFSGLEIGFSFRDLDASIMAEIADGGGGLGFDFQPCSFDGLLAGSSHFGDVSGDGFVKFGLEIGESRCEASLSIKEAIGFVLDLFAFVKEAVIEKFLAICVDDVLADFVTHKFPCMRLNFVPKGIDPVLEFGIEAWSEEGNFLACR